MKSFESIGRSASPEQNNRDEGRREYHFRAIIQEHLVDTFRESLEEAGFAKDEIERFAVTLAELPDGDAEKVLALPFQLREKLLARYHEKGMAPPDIVQDILQKNRKHGFALGYHLAKSFIPKKGKEGSQEWTINGTELDDRDDMRMAYYSEDYLNRYKKNAGRYLYIVRAEIGENSSHKRDLKNRWGRAPFLSVIDEYDLEDIEREVDTALKKEDAATNG